MQAQVSRLLIHLLRTLPSRSTDNGDINRCRKPSCSLELTTGPSSSSSSPSHFFGAAGFFA